MKTSLWLMGMLFASIAMADPPDRYAIITVASRELGSIGYDVQVEVYGPINIADCGSITTKMATVARRLAPPTANDPWKGCVLKFALQPLSTYCILVDASPQGVGTLWGYTCQWLPALPALLGERS